MAPTGPDQLLPKSGVGVAGPWLVIAPAGNPIIRVDLRLLDRVELCADVSEEDEGEDGSRDLPDGWTDPRGELLLVCGELEVGLVIEDGAEAAARIVQECSAHTRSAAANATAGRETSFPASAPHRDAFLFVGRDAVLVEGDRIRIGSLLFRIGEVREYALRGANIPLSGGRLLQAAMALLVVALAEAEATDELTSR